MFGRGRGGPNLFTDDCLSAQLNGKFWFGDPLSGDKFSKELKNVQDPRHFYNQVTCTFLFIIVNVFFMIRIFHHAQQQHHHSLHHLVSFTDPLASSLSATIYNIVTIINNIVTIIYNIVTILICVKMAENYEEVVRGWGYNMPEVKKQNHSFHQKVLVVCILTTNSIPDGS